MEEAQDLAGDQLERRLNELLDLEEIKFNVLYDNQWEI